MTYDMVALYNALLHVGLCPRRNSGIVMGRKRTCINGVYMYCQPNLVLAVVFVLHGCLNPNDA